MLLSGRQISMWLPDFCTRASAEVSTKPARMEKVNCNKEQPWPKSETEKLSENIHHSMQNCFEGNPDLTDAYNKSDEFPYIPMNWSYLPPNNMVFLKKKIHHHTILNRYPLVI